MQAMNEQDQEFVRNTLAEVVEILSNTFGPAEIDGEPQFERQEEASIFLQAAYDNWRRLTHEPPK